MKLAEKNRHYMSCENSHLLCMLDSGIDDMESGKEFSLEEAFLKITELRDAGRNVGI